MTSSPAELFLSHSTADGPAALALAETLRRPGVPVWYAPDRLVGSELWIDEIGAALDRCDWFLVLVSSQTRNSFWVKREIQYALTQGRLVGRITAVVVDSTDARDLSWVFQTVQQIREADFTQSARQVLRMWGIGLDASKLATPGDPS